MKADSLGDRMKQYEDVSRIHLPRRLPLIIRLDGKAFHTWTRGLERPYCQPLMAAMDEVTKALCKEIQNVKLAYTQSDEISLLLVDYIDIRTSSWFESNLQKMVSVAASIASSQLTIRSKDLFGTTKPAYFDARAFVLPEHEINNYFIWRQQDWNRNSLAMLAQSLYSHRELHGKGRAEQHEMCFAKGHNWAELSSHIKEGRVAIKREVVRETLLPSRPDPFSTVRREWHILEETPNFASDPNFVGNLT